MRTNSYICSTVSLRGRSALANTHAMLTIDRAREILGEYAATKTDAEIQALLVALALLAEHALESAQRVIKIRKAS